MFRQSHRLNIGFSSATYFRPICHPSVTKVSPKCPFDISTVFQPHFSRGISSRAVFLSFKQGLDPVCEFWWRLHPQSLMLCNDRFAVVSFEQFFGVLFGDLHQYLLIILTVITSKHPVINATTTITTICNLHSRSICSLRVKLSSGLHVRFLGSGQDICRTSHNLSYYPHNGKLVILSDRHQKSQSDPYEIFS